MHPLPPPKEPEPEIVVEEVEEEETPWWLKGVIQPKWVETDVNWAPPSEDAPMRTTWLAPPPWALQDMTRI